MAVTNLSEGNAVALLSPDVRDCGRIHRAKWIAVSPDLILENGFLVTAEGRVAEIGEGRCLADFPVSDHGDGVITPALVNAHTHLELSALKGRVPVESGFLAWVQSLLQAREDAGPERLEKGALAGIEELRASGCGAVGEISTLGLTRKMLLASGLAGVWFQEYLGGAEQKIPVEAEAFRSNTGSPDMAVSVAGHAPHTTAPELLNRLCAVARKRGMPFSIHLDESEAEREFLQTGKGKWADFLAFRGIDVSGWPVPASGPVQYAEALRILGNHTLAVHLIDAGPEEFAILRNRRVNVCICPRSNRALHHRLPDVLGMLQHGLRPCLGTDSLASADSLSIFDEMRFLSRQFPEIPPSEIFGMATQNGAVALGMAHRFGTLFPEKSFNALYIDTHCNKPSQLMEQILYETI